MAQQLVLAFFGNEAAADNAVEAIKQWDKADKDVKLGGIGVLVKDDKGKIKTHKLGARRTKGGAVLFGLAALLTGGMAIGVGVVGGAVVGGIIGALFHKGLKMSDKEKEQLNKELDSGKAAVGVMSSAEGASLVSAKLAELGGQPATYEVTDEAVAEAQQAVQAAPETPEEPAAPTAEAPAEKPAA